MQIVMNGFGEYLGVDRKKQRFAVFKDGKRIEDYPFHLVKQVQVTPGNNLSSSALFWASMYGTNVVVVSNTGRPLSMLLPFSCDAHAKTKVKQYEAYQNVKGVNIAKTILLAKVENQARLLEEYGLDSQKIETKIPLIEKVKGKRIDLVRQNLYITEAHCSRIFFKEYSKLFPERFEFRYRVKTEAKDPINNLLNFGYEILKGEIYKDVLLAHLDPYLGYLHSIQFGKPSLVCDLQEVFRYYIEKFVVEYSKGLDLEDFEKVGERLFLKRERSLEAIQKINEIFDSKIRLKKAIKNGKNVSLRALMRYETLNLGAYVRNEIAVYRLKISYFNC